MEIKDVRCGKAEVVMLVGALTYVISGDRESETRVSHIVLHQFDPLHSTTLGPVQPLQLSTIYVFKNLLSETFPGQ